MAYFLSPSLLSADFANLQASVEMLNASAADWIHVDVMDGHFVPNITLGPAVVKAVYKHACKPLDVHLMIENPDIYLAAFQEAGAEYLSVHIEACTHLNRSLAEIHRLGMKAGVAVNPHTSIKALENIIEYCDLILIMSVNPGFGGQKFIESSYRKIEETALLRQKYHPELIIEVDGGVNLQNAPLLLEAGANALVAGNAIFSAKNKLECMRQFKQL